MKTRNNKRATVRGAMQIALALGITVAALQKRRNAGCYSAIIHRDPISGRVWAYEADLAKQRAEEGR